ncbi:MAG: hypothetical protein GY866_34485 [Proteobacteria bacterium]|nr:hypothetical protein [Pseudomonadota bacterium]
MGNGKAIEPEKAGRLKRFFLAVREIKGKVDEYDDRIYETQRDVSKKYDNYFTFNVVLVLAIVMGGSFAFFGRDCHGMAGSSPLLVFMILTALFTSFQTFLLIPLSVSRLVRLAAAVFCGFSLSFELYGLYSIEVMEYENACKPYMYTNSALGYFWAIGPLVAILVLCFSLGKK